MSSWPEKRGRNSLNFQLYAQDLESMARRKY
jgi:hypothetical protein